MLENFRFPFLFALLLPRIQQARTDPCDRPSTPWLYSFSSNLTQMLKWFPSSTLLPHTRTVSAAVPF